MQLHLGLFFVAVFLLFRKPPDLHSHASPYLTYYLSHFHSCSAPRHESHFASRTLIMI
uniref:Uncharacterized protein n=1 Tax=Picea glauca TaxID=3330 RepID=A0A101LZ52_PICGL|nr:hypothetical protein ABT39_MTgene4965 [Picea glauca]QHR90397.1 hypothetical protein Q903MT_gene4420 [Picea sitchensis]